LKPAGRFGTGSPRHNKDHASARDANERRRLKLDDRIFVDREGRRIRKEYFDASTTFGAEPIARHERHAWRGRFDDVLAIESGCAVHDGDMRRRFGGRGVLRGRRRRERPHESHHRQSVPGETHRRLGPVSSEVHRINLL
jgi:hypothetical protein